MILKNNKNNTPYTLEIEHWDTELPTGSWIGPESLPLFPSLERTHDSVERLLEIRELHILYHPALKQRQKIVDWVKNNISNDIRWLFHGLEEHHPQFQKIFFALPAVHLLQKNEDSKLRISRPEIYKDDWDKRLDSCRANFLKYLEEINCLYQLVRNNEALDNGMLILKEYLTMVVSTTP